MKIEINLKIIFVFLLFVLLNNIDTYIIFLIFIIIHEISHLTIAILIGAVPKNKPMVVNPKAKAGFLFKTETNIPKVTAIVIEKNITPKRDTIIKLSPINRNGMANKVLKTATFFIPNISDNIPPKHLPIPIITNK